METVFHCGHYPSFCAAFSAVDFTSSVYGTSLETNTPKTDKASVEKLYGFII